MNTPGIPGSPSASGLDNEAARELAVLEAVEVNPSVSQRALARDMGVALGVVNACIRALVRKGLLKIQGESNRTITYHLTHEGALRKATLAVTWTRNTFEFYRSARRQVGEHLASLAAQGHRVAAVYGASELAEIAVLVSAGSGLEIVVAVPGQEHALGEEILGVPVSRDVLVRADEVDIIVLAEEISPAELAWVAEAFPGAAHFSLLGQPLEGVA